jgi:predicted DNA-binding protein YlxM (UPF0122 family)
MLYIKAYAEASGMTISLFGRVYGMGKDMELSFLFDFYGEMLTDKQRDVFGLYYEEDLSLAEIAENTGITRQGVRDAVKRAEGQLREMEERLGLAKRFRKMQSGFSDIARAAAEIDELNKRIGRSHDISERVRNITELSGTLAGI